MTDIEFEYADYCINKLRNSCQTFDDIDEWFNSKSHRDNRLNSKELKDIRSILSKDDWIIKDITATLYKFNETKTEILNEYGSYSNYRKSSANDLTKLGFKEKPKTRWQKLIDFSLNGFWLWLERIGYLLAIPLAIIAFRQCSIDSKNQKLKSQQEMKPSQTNSKTKPTDSTYILKTN